TVSARRSDSARLYSSVPRGSARPMSVTVRGGVLLMHSPFLSIMPLASPERFNSLKSRYTACNAHFSLPLPGVLSSKPDPARLQRPPEHLPPVPHSSSALHGRHAPSMHD